jgi:hypothetical protein
MVWILLRIGVLPPNPFIRRGKWGHPNRFYDDLDGYPIHNARSGGDGPPSRW